MIQMLFIDSVPPALVNFLKDPKIQLAGVGIDGDIQKLHRDHGLKCNGAIELTTLAAKKYERVDLKGAGLKALAKLVINFDMVKQKKVTMSNWANRCLDQIQLEYACLDAWVSYAIHEGLVEAPAL
jgi:ribonuclease D